MENEQETHFEELTDEQLDAVNGGCNSLVNTEVCAGAGVSALGLVNVGVGACAGLNVSE